MTIYNSTNNISEDYTFIIDINEILYTQEELNTLNLDIYQYASSQDDITWNTVNSSDIDDIYTILGNDLAGLSNPNILDITADFSEILEESQESNETVLIYCGIQDSNRNGFPEFDDNQYFILLIHRNPESYYCIPIKSHILDNNIQIADVSTFETFEPLDFEYLSAKQIIKLISKKIHQSTEIETPFEDADLNTAMLHHTNGVITQQDFNICINDEIADIWNQVSANTSFLNSHTHGIIRRDGSITGATADDVLKVAGNGQIATTSLKTINNESLIGSGNITITGGSGGSVNIRTSSTGFSSILTDTDVPSEKLIKEYVDNAIGSIQNFIHS